MKAPHFARYEGGDLASFVNDLVGQLERAMTDTPQGRSYTVANGVTARTLDVSTATTTDAAKTLGTLIADLKTAGVIA